MGVAIGRGGADGDLHEFGGAFAVADDELGETLREGCEDLLQGCVVGGVARGDGRGGGRGGSGAVGEDGDCVVGGGVAVDGDGVE